MSTQDSMPSVAPQTLAFYGAPVIGVTAMTWLVMLYLLKYGSSVLGIAPAAMGALFALGRLWDAVTDPVTGYCSDRYATRLGRRRPWMLVAALPVGLSFLALWCVPSALPETFTLAWMGAGILLFYTAQTLFSVPHSSLGAELSDNHHERTRIFATRACFEVVGIALAIGGLHLLENSATPRWVAGQLSILFGGLAAAGIALAAIFLKERPEYVRRGPRHPYAALRDVCGNRHARVLLAVMFLSELGYSCLMVSLPFASDKLLGAAGSTSLYLVCFALPMAISLPAWVPVTRRLGKKWVWVASLAISSAAIAAISFTLGGDPVWMYAIAAIVGVMNGATRSVPLSVQADVIDYDELKTGQRKEGAYFAAWNFTTKAGGGCAIALSGMLLQVSGIAEGEGGRTELLLVFSALPVVFLCSAALVLSRFTLDEAEHREIRSRLAENAPVGAESAVATT